MRARTAIVASALAVGLVQVVPAAASVSDGNPNDPLWPKQWGPHNVNAPAAWASTTGEGSTIAIVDCGIDLDHPDLRANIVGGYDAVERNSGGRGDWDPNNDDEGCTHGTHVAGIAGAVGDNGEGIVGIAPDANLLAVRVLDDDGSGSYEDIADGVRWATRNGADVINMSLGGLPGTQALSIVGFEADLADAIAEANAAGVVVVAAAGNDSLPLCNDPAFSEGVLCVTANDKRDAHTWYSSGAIHPDLLAVSAPGGAGTVVACGEEILSTVPQGTSFEDCGSGPDYEELFWFGTSMASPHVAGTAALLTSLGCDREQTLDAITSTARTPVTDEPRGVYDPLYGYGIVDAGAAVAAAPCAGGGSTGGTTGDPGGNTAPVAADDSARSNGSAVTIDVLANDGDPDGDTLTITEVSQPANGTATTDGSTVTYTPKDGFSGHDTFTYTVSDGNGGTDTATVDVNVRRKGGGNGKSKG